jgi:flagella basal body P-ring formation protein FlgA
MNMERFAYLTERKAVAGAAFCLFGILVLLTAGAGNCRDDRAVIEISSRATVNGKLIRLRDIARVVHDDARRRTLLSEVVIGKSPLPGSAKTVDSNFVTMRLRQHGVDLSRIRLHMPAPVTIVRGFQRVPAARIKAAVSRFIAGWRSGRAEDLRIGDIHVGRQVVVSPGTLELRVEPLRRGLPNGRLPLSVTLLVDGKVEKKVFATVDVDVMCQAVFARQVLKRNHVIEAQDVDLRQVPRSALPRNYIDSIADIVGTKTKRTVAAAVPLRPDLVEIPCLIHRRDVVVIMASMQGMQVTTLGEARQKGRRGDRIKVVNLDSKKTVYARVVDSSTVAVDF